MGVVGTLALGAGCVLDDEIATPEIADVTQAVNTGNVNIREVILTPDVLADWTQDRQISQALVTGHTLKVRYCAEHFPPNSTQLANLMSALGTYNGAAGVAINLVDVAEQPGTTTHPNLNTFTLPEDTIYYDYDDSYPPGSGVFAETGIGACDSSSPRQCTHAHTYLNSKKYTTDAPSKGVFVHELGHVFGMSHINADDDSVTKLDPQDMWFDRTTIHGFKHDAEDRRGIALQAGTLAFLRYYYAATTDGTLGTDEVVADRAFTFVGETDANGVTPHYEWDPAKAFEGWGTAGSLIGCGLGGQCLNEVKLRWNSTLDIGTGTLGGFEPCNLAGTLPHWFARISETSTNTVDKLFDSVFEVTNSDLGTNYFAVATQTLDSYIAGQADFRQIDWDVYLPLSLAAFGLSSAPTTKTLRTLRFRADSNNSLLERNGANNDWEVTLCLYPSGSLCSAACDQ
jgi:hypothetical protein